MIPVIEAFVRTVDFMDRLREEGHVRDYALIGGLALSAWAVPRNTRDVDLVVALAEGTTWPVIAARVESGFRKQTVVKKGTRRTTIQDKLSFVAGQIEVDLIGTRGFALAEEAMENALGAQDRIDIGALIKKTDRRKLRVLARKHFLLARLEPVLQEAKTARSKSVVARI